MQPAAKNVSFRLVLAMLSAALSCGCEQRGDAAAGDTAQVQAPALRCGRGGFLTAEVIGAVSTTLDWDAEHVSCEGMPRPEGQGARLRFSGASEQLDQTVAVIIALPDLARGKMASELGSNVTFAVEGSGRFFSTAGPGVCWTDVTRQEPLSGDRYAIGGRLYCIGPLTEVNGDSSVSIPELVFSGLLDWGAK